MRCKPSSVPPASRVTMPKAKTIYLDLPLLISSPDGKRSTRDSNGMNKTSSLLDLTPGGVYRTANFTIRVVRSYRTISPLPPGPYDGGSIPLLISLPEAVYFLWHWPGRWTDRKTRTSTVGVTHHRSSAVLGLSSAYRSKQRPSTHLATNKYTRFWEFLQMR